MSKNTIKAGILVVILVVPAFIFIFLKLFGNNYYKLPYFMPETDDRGMVLMKGADTVFHQIPAFELTDQNGQKFSSEQTKGKIYVADFFFTRCGTICPKLSSAMLRVQDVFMDNPDVMLISHSVDPNHDTPQVLKEYAKKFDAKNGKWFFLTGEKKAIYDLAIKGYKLPVADASEYDKNIKNVDEMFIHSEKIMLIDKDGYIRGIYDGTFNADIERLQAEIKVLEEIYKDQNKSR
ncbi:SCO family protein [Emticicia sp. 21SJ11W-3]|uniref:SCO family protein n=1 Tax=Emticicia sp. 21SJ11W-3 TaxID=2916755 RepID=UPI00209DC786|nr:SCO family protein [Emticicia sp. 21SJ11W-3]UTA67581.1 SCO family protein [Emticicia sp. 21SJ11W-3]